MQKIKLFALGAVLTVLLSAGASAAFANVPAHGDIIVEMQTTSVPTTPINETTDQSGNNENQPGDWMPIFEVLFGFSWSV